MSSGQYGGTRRSPFAAAPMSQKHMILSGIVDQIGTGRGYRINNVFKLTAQQFIDPDGDAAVNQKVSYESTDETDGLL